jgi:hypothetical protein
MRAKFATASAIKLAHLGIDGIENKLDEVLIALLWRVLDGYRNVAEF